MKKKSLQHRQRKRGENRVGAVGSDRRRGLKKRGTQRNKKPEPEKAKKEEIYKMRRGESAPVSKNEK